MASFFPREGPTPAAADTYEYWCDACQRQYDRSRAKVGWALQEADRRGLDVFLVDTEDDGIQVGRRELS